MQQRKDDVSCFKQGYKIIRGAKLWEVVVRLKTGKRYAKEADRTIKKMVRSLFLFAFWGKELRSGMRVGLGLNNIKYLGRR